MANRDLIESLKKSAANNTSTAGAANAGGTGNGSASQSIGTQDRPRVPGTVSSGASGGDMKSYITAVRGSGTQAAAPAAEDRNAVPKQETQQETAPAAGTQQQGVSGDGSSDTRNGVKGTVPLTPGQRNADETRAVQAALGVTVDGMWGPETERAWRASGQPVESWNSVTGLLDASQLQAQGRLQTGQVPAQVQGQGQAVQPYAYPTDIELPKLTPLENKADAYRENQRALLDQWLEAAKQQSANARDYATNRGIDELTRAEEDAREQFDTQRKQIDIDEARGLDNLALYNERRGDRGGIGAAQYNNVQNTAAINRLAVNQAQVKLSTDTKRNIADLRAQGEYQKADDLLQLTQDYLTKLVSLEQWAAEYGLTVDQFNAQLEKWNYEYEMNAASLTGVFRGYPTLAAQQYNNQLAMQEAAYTGYYNGAPTLDMQRLQLSQAAQDADYTGLYNGSPTLAARQYADQLALSEASLTGTYNGAPTVAMLSTLADAGLAAAQAGIMPSDSQIDALERLYGYGRDAVEGMVQTAQLGGSITGYQTAFELMYADGINSTIDAVDWLQRHEDYLRWSYEEKVQFANQYASWLARRAAGEGQTGTPYLMRYGVGASGPVSRSDLNSSIRGTIDMVGAAGGVLGSKQPTGATSLDILPTGGSASSGVQTAGYAGGTVTGLSGARLGREDDYAGYAPGVSGDGSPDTGKGDRRTVPLTPAGSASGSYAGYSSPEAVANAVSDGKLSNVDGTSIIEAGVNAGAWTERSADNALNRIMGG